MNNSGWTNIYAVLLIVLSALWRKIWVPLQYTDNHNERILSVKVYWKVQIVLFLNGRLLQIWNCIIRLIYYFLGEKMKQVFLLLIVLTQWKYRMWNYLIRIFHKLQRKRIEVRAQKIQGFFFPFLSF